MSDIPIAPPLPLETTSNHEEKAVATFAMGQKILSETIKREHFSCADVNGSLLSYFCNELTAILQNGPTCGIVALAMALRGNDETCNNLLVEAQRQGFSNKGEIFSCAWMQKLAESWNCFQTSHIFGGLLNHTESILACIQKGGSVLVPYDSLQNHAPGLRNGRSAHWAVVCGFAVLKVDEHSEADCALPENVDKAVCQSVSTHSEVDPNREKSLNVLSDNTHSLMIVAYQGKSAKPKIWNFLDLVKSNDNLREVKPEVASWAVLPEGGIECGLRGQAILISKLK